MNMRWLLAVALTTTACASTTDPPGPRADEPIRSGQLQVIVLPNADGTFPSDVQVGCPTGPNFPASALAGTTPLTDRPAIEDAIRPFLDSAEGAFWPQDGWHVLHESADIGIIANRRPGGVAFMTVELRDGEWRWAGAAGEQPCPLRVATPQKFNTVEWQIDPDLPAPQAGDTEINVVAVERECVSGQAMGDRLLVPEVVMTDEEVLIAFVAVPPPGDAQTCQGNPSQRVVVDLPEPLGDRQIRNGLEVLGNLEDFLP